MNNCTHHFEHVKQTRPFTEREYMQCTKCGHQNTLGLFQHWDTERDGPAVKWPPRDNGGKLPAGLTPITNHTGRGILISPYPRKRKRQPIVKVRREVLSNSYGTLTRWNWRCHICGLGRAQSGWWIAYDTATRHAHNHHRSGK